MVIILNKETNRVITQLQPWAKTTSSSTQAIVYAYHALRQAGILLQTVIPTKSAELLDRLGVPKNERTWDDANWPIKINTQKIQDRLSASQTYSEPLFPNKIETSTSSTHRDNAKPIDPLSSSNKPNSPFPSSNQPFPNLPFQSSSMPNQVRLLHTSPAIDISTPPPPSQAEQPEYTVPKSLPNWLFACSALIFCIVVIGGLTRLTESGLSITEWEPITGILPPLTDEQWEVEWEKYRISPEGVL